MGEGRWRGVGDRREVGRAERRAIKKITAGPIVRKSGLRCFSERVGSGR
jgi:hypothetical protein